MPWLGYLKDMKHIVRQGEHLPKYIVYTQSYYSSYYSDLFVCFLTIHIISEKCIERLLVTTNESESCIAGHGPYILQLVTEG